MKTCNHCSIAKPFSEFYKKSAAKDGLFWWCRECHKTKMKAKYQELASDKEYRAKETQRVGLFLKENPNIRKKYGQTYMAKHRAKLVAKTNLYRISKDCRTPAWLTQDDKWMIEQAYELAVVRTKIFGFPWHVDHVVPLHGELVSGLHVPHNLQVIPAWDNRSKSNQFDVTT